MSLPSFLGQEMLAKCSYFWRGCCFTHSPSTFVTRRVIILLCVTLWISLFGWSVWTLSIIWFHLKLCTDIDRYFMEILQRKRHVNTVNYRFSFIKHQYYFFQKLKKQNNANMVNIQKYRFVTDGISEQFSYFIFNTFATQGIQFLPN